MKKPKQVQIRVVLKILGRLEGGREKLDEVRDKIDEHGQDRDDYLNTEYLENFLGEELARAFFAEYQNDPPE